MDVVLQYDLLGGMIEADCRQPPPVSQCPAFLARVDPVMAKQKTLQLLAGPGDVAYRCGAQADQITHRLMSGVGYPDARQFASTMKSGQHGGISAICLN